MLDPMVLILTLILCHRNSALRPVQDQHLICCLVLKTTDYWRSRLSSDFNESSFPFRWSTSPVVCGSGWLWPTAALCPIRSWGWWWWLTPCPRPPSTRSGSTVRCLSPESTWTWRSFTVRTGEGTHWSLNTHTYLIFCLQINFMLLVFSTETKVILFWPISPLVLQFFRHKAWDIGPAVSVFMLHTWFPRSRKFFPDRSFLFMSSLTQSSLV